MIHPSSVIIDSQLGNNVSVGPGCLIRDCIIGDDVVIEWNVLIEKSHIHPLVEILWWSLIRESTIASWCIIWCEVKRSTLGARTMAKHPGTTIGSLTCWEDVNFWSGVKCANYDGKWKGTFVLWRGVFLWCNTVLSVKADTVRTIGNNIKIWALVHVDQDVPSDTLVYTDRKTGTVTYREGYLKQP
jgi:bifunctional UDP-N-acetylglucosamine pyrophosphorylase / glucosamine-1-phosphate N-acetyltransferase